MFDTHFNTLSRLLLFWICMGLYFCTYSQQTLLVHLNLSWLATHITPFHFWNGLTLLFHHLHDMTRATRSLHPFTVSYTNQNKLVPGNHNSFLLLTFQNKSEWSQIFPTPISCVCLCAKTNFERLKNVLIYSSYASKSLYTD